jgi:hypothetical protein
MYLKVSSIVAKLAAVSLATASVLAVAAGGGDLPADAPINIKDPQIQALHNLVYDQKPPPPVPGVDYGIDAKTGVLHHPKVTPLITDFPNLKGPPGYWDQNSYANNVEVIGIYEDIFVVDAKDVTAPKIVAKLPRPVPPKEAPFTDYCQRKGSFGPKRPGYHTTQPVRWQQGMLDYALYSAGVQLFDVSDPLNATIAGYYVPRFPTSEEAPGT